MKKNTESSKVRKILNSDDIVSSMLFSELVKPISISESPALKQISEMAKKMSLYESPALKQISEMAKKMPLYESPALKQVSEMAKQMPLYESPALKQVSEMAKQMPLYESPALKQVSEMAKQMSLYESPVLKQASAIAKQMSLYESPVLKQASEIAKQMSLYESPVLKQASEMAKQMSLYESSALKQASKLVKRLSVFESTYLKYSAEISRSFITQEAASLMATSSLGRMFSENDSNAIRAVREMSGSILQQNLSSILDGIGVKTDFEINEEVIEDTVTQFGAAALSENKDNISEWYNNQSTATQLIIGLILSYWVGVFCNLSMPLYDDWSHIFSDTNSRAATKQVVHEARKEYDINDLKNYYFVVASILHVRTEPSINSEILDELINGKTVKFIEKSKRWVLIEYLCDETGEYTRGWVFARYLHRFKV